MKITSLYFGSYGERYSDPVETFVGTTAAMVDEALEYAIEHCDYPDYCDHGDEKCTDECEDCDGRECSLCWPDFANYGACDESAHPVRYGYVTLRELREIWPDLKAGRVCSLAR